MKPPSDLGDVIASRIFERDDGNVEMTFYKPSPWPDPKLDRDPSRPPWRCFYSIVFPDGETKTCYSAGIDSIQALLLAFGGGAHRLRYMCDGTPTVRPPVRWNGESDLGLSIDHFDWPD